MKFQCVMKVRSTVEIVELTTVKQLQVAMLEMSGFQQSEVDHVLQSQGIKDGSRIVAVKLDGIYIGACGIGERRQQASYFGFYDRRSKAIRVLESEFKKRCAKRQYALVG